MTPESLERVIGRSGPAQPLTRRGAGMLTASALIAGLIGYGRLQGRVEAIDTVSGPKAVMERVERMRQAVEHIDGRLEAISRELGEIRGELRGQRHRERRDPASGTSVPK